MKRQKFEFSNITSLSLPWYNKYINLFMPSILQSSFHYLPLFLHSSLPPPIQDSLPPSMDLYLLSSSVSFTLPSFHLPSISQFIFLSPNVSLHFSLSLVLFLFYIHLPPLIHCSIIIPIAVSAPPFIQTNSSPSMLHLPRPLSSLNLFSPS